MADRKRYVRWGALGLAAIAGVAWGSPWDIDMVDAHTFKAYEWKMLPQPAATVARGSTSAPRPQSAGHYQNGEVGSVTRANAPATDALSDPYAADPNHIATGTRLFRVNCAPCHGLEGTGNGPVTYNDVDKGIRRFPMAAPVLSGATGTIGSRSDGYIYATIRNGGLGSAGATAEIPAGTAAIGDGMPAYGALLTDSERWAVVAYLRTLPNAARIIPEPVAPLTPAQLTPAPGTPE